MLGEAIKSRASRRRESLAEALRQTLTIAGRHPGSWGAGGGFGGGYVAMQSMSK